jgi:undecaprenyl-diphosphatase
VVSLFSPDLSVLKAVYAGGLPAGFVNAIAVVSFLGSGWMLLGLVPPLLVRRYRPRAAAALATLTLTSVAVASMKALFGRIRPCNALAWAHTLSIDAPSDHSFPSGHAAGSFAFALLVWNTNRRAGWILIALASLVAASRVALGVHYPSDVIAGALLGSGLGWTAARLYPRSTAAANVEAR